MRAAILSLSLLPLPALAGPAAMPQPDSPQHRPPGGIVTVSSSQSGLDQWIAGFRPRALSAGIAPATLDLALRGIRYNDGVIEKDRNQAEFTRTIWDYLDSAVSDLRVENGKAALSQHRRTLDRLEARYGVPAEVVTAIWGLESSYGANRGDIPVIEALATLAHDGRRGAFFEAQLIDALKILQSGDARINTFTGSWAGAMGHTQFIPSSFHSFAVDFNGDGRRDIWSDDPTDALASTAAYLAKSGWQPGLPWGIEVTLPDGIDYMLAGKPIVASYSGYPSMVNEADCGVFVPVEDVDALRAEFERLALLSPAERKAMGERGRTWLLENRRFETLASDYLRHLGLTSQGHNAASKGVGHVSGP